jgi:hypothetical protein
VQEFEETVGIGQSVLLGGIAGLLPHRCSQRGFVVMWLTYLSIIIFLLVRLNKINVQYL